MQLPALIIFFLSGITHFTDLDGYVSLMPQAIPLRSFWVIVSGLVELAGARLVLVDQQYGECQSVAHAFFSCGWRTSLKSGAKSSPGMCGGVRPLGMYGGAQTVAARGRYKVNVRNANLVREADLVVVVCIRPAKSCAQSRVMLARARPIGIFELLTAEAWARALGYPADELNGTSLRSLTCSRFARS